MAIIAIRQTWIDGLNRDQRKLVRWTLAVGLGADAADGLESAGAPYRMSAGSSAVWRIFSDSRWTLQDIAEVTTAAGQINRIDEGQLDGFTRAEIRERFDTAIANRVVTPDYTQMSADADPVEYTRDAQSSKPGEFRAYREIPDGAFPHEES